MGYQNAIGVTLTEKVRNSLALGSSVSTRNIGILMARTRGVANLPTLITDQNTDTQLFGGFDPSMYSPYVVKNMFDNLGGYGVNYYGLRIVGAGSVAASVNVTNFLTNTQAIATVISVPASTGVQEVRTSTISGDIDAGDVFSYTYSGLTVTYEAVLGDTPATVAAGLFAALEAYIVANPASAIATDLTITYTPGQTYITTTAVATDTGIAITTTATNATVTNLFTVGAGQQGQADVGTWGNALSVRVYPVGDPNGDPNNYLFQVLYQGIVVESYLATTWALLAGQVNTQSNYVMITVLAGAVPLLNDPFIANLTGGVYVAPIQSDFTPRYDVVTLAPLGMQIFEAVDVQIVLCPEMFALSFHQACDTFASSTQKFYIFNMPYLATESQLTTYYNGLFKGDESYTSSYLQWAQVDDGSGNGTSIWIPALGYVLGAGYLRTAGTNNGRAWTPPAGIGTTSVNVYQFTHATLTQATSSRYVQTWLCNYIQFVKGTGWVIWSSRTMSTNILFMSIHIRLETNWLAASLIIRGAKFVQRLITASFLKEVQTDFLAFMQNIYNQGGIENTISFNNAVIVTVTVNPTDRKNCLMEISWIPPECNELLSITLSRNDGILSQV
jgi:hypothetical protein